MENQKFYYDNKTVKLFILATIIWGVVGILVGILAALQLAFPAFNFGLEYTTFGRIRPLHTNAIIFAFVGNAIFAGVYYSMQKLLKTRMFSDRLSKINFWGWQLIIVLAAVTFVLGISTAKEYAELEWPIDILIAVVWVIFGWNMIGTILKRRVQHIYAAIWWYIATFIGVAILHVVNSFELPISLTKSYSIYAGAQDAVVQWWYGHNAVAFFLTTPFLGLMYYYLPKAANRPIYSYKLSIIHFWSLIFLYMWAGPHHLLYQALPEWAQALGVTFSIMLIAPSWGGMINGLLTLRGAWDKVRDSAALKFFVVAVTAYGMSTFEGPMMSLKSVNQITHFTDWTIAHVHIGGMGWNGGLVFGMLYWLIPKLFKTKLFSEKLANIHFWMSTLAILIYAIPLYWSAVTQWLMWREYTPEGYLAYPNFLETLTQILPMYTVRILAGVLFLGGFLVMSFNLFKTMATGKVEDNEAAEAPALVPAGPRNPVQETVHRWMERKGVRFSVWVFIALVIGGAVEIIPMIFIKSNVPTIDSVKPYTPLELEGRDIYISEGCYVCHSQMVRPFRWETDRYGEYSKIGEFVYDHPYQWGSRRTGPDLGRAGVVGGPMYKNAAWHYNHFLDPQKMNEQSIMPNYAWFAEKDVDLEMTPKKIRAMQTLGVPYEEGYDQKAIDDYMIQAKIIVDDLKASGIEIEPTKQMVAMIAYMHKLGKDISVPVEQETATSGEITKESVELLSSQADLDAAKQIFQTTCVVCHGSDGKGIATFPSLVDDEWINGNQPEQVYTSIANGNVAKGMIAYKNQYNEEQITQLASYILLVLNNENSK
ncbi:cytochrome-c oxidase, cbb3-type subunit I [Maribellus comscasis]|uniref:cytochrome-c oxidase, cbb3-type subunit I n=1 Tax=Maribellus comscasis TaxID=2681766 RepID=UPI00131AED97|nr:cytochrome-c oxidase, cbb3-type subunit I [Maribellus comscasis]